MRQLDRGEPAGELSGDVLALLGTSELEFTTDFETIMFVDFVTVRKPRKSVSDFVNVIDPALSWRGLHPLGRRWLTLLRAWSETGLDLGEGVVHVLRHWFDSESFVVRQPNSR